MGLANALESRATRAVLPPSWPVWVATAAYPLWWALGLTTVIYPCLAVVLAWYLLRMRPLRFPPGWMLWASFLLVVVISAVMLGVDAPGTAAQSGIGAYGYYILRLLSYLSVTLLLLYVGNHDDRSLPVRAVVRALVVLGVVIGILGVTALVFPGFSFTPPASYVLPEVLVGDGTARLAQIQDILGATAPRPSAPFEYTNTWGEVMSMALVWMVAHAAVYRRHRIWILGVAAASIVPILESLNRGVWMGMLLTIAYLAVRLAVRHRLGTVAALVGVVVIGSGAVVLTPAGQLVEARLETGHSDNIRENLAADAIRLANESPILGYGSTRRTQGSYESIAIGPSSDCPQCGERVIGSTGQLWLLLVAQGWLGTILYVSYFVFSLWAFRRDHSPSGIAASAVILLSLFYLYFYSALGVPMVLAMLAIAVLWRNAQSRSLDQLRSLSGAGRHA